MEACRAKRVPCNKHPLRVGVPGKAYSEYDYVTPILDAMTAMHEQAYGTGILSLTYYEERRKRRAREDVDSVSLYTIKRFKAPAHGVLCSGCNTTDRTKFRLTPEGTMVCLCGAEGVSSFRDDFKETAGTDKGAARADAPCSDVVGTVCTMVPASARRKCGLGYAHENATRAGDQPKMSRGNTRKLSAIIESIGKLLLQVAPVDSAIAQKITRDAETVFHASVEHHKRCKKKNCQKAMFNKLASVIAAKSFVYTVEQLSIGECVSGVSRQTITALQERVQCSPAFNQRDNATQHHACLAMISALMNTDNWTVCPDAPPDAEPQASKGISLQRQHSDVQSSAVVQLRDAISSLSIEYGYPKRVRDVAMLALQNADFASSIKCVGEKSGNMACAYLVLQSICEATNSKTVEYADDRVRRVGLSSTDVAPVVSRMRAALPAHVLLSCSDADDDELY